MSLTLSHVLLVALATAVGAALGRAIRARSRRLQYLKEIVRAAAFLLGVVAVVAFVALSPGTAVEKSTLAGFYIGALYGLVASEPRRPSGRRDRERGGPSAVG
ncbi:MAG: hypothetical protein K6V97_11685 [Actinomycetia bacterium]|nr:hypothetical protein [Actinomycetes bacterium]